ncbi:hypothetical protein EVAR_4941_1 [Eumeta japonica]|uniref:Uncharacterized protein n=1 Tax=Eumeta variegata TaxID=151549 RepID=A0A4C1V0C5_EUMVA|nr:hypothetical protein EVAR_4941_1 [Eumeta japonica]
MTLPRSKWGRAGSNSICCTDTTSLLVFVPRDTMPKNISIHTMETLHSPVMMLIELSTSLDGSALSPLSHRYIDFDKKCSIAVTTRTGEHIESFILPTASAHRAIAVDEDCVRLTTGL